MMSDTQIFAIINALGYRWLQICWTCMDYYPNYSILALQISCFL